jgi:phosphoglycolate phosphatase
MAAILDLLAAVLRRWCPSVAAARQAAESAWFEPDPVATAVPIADLPALFRGLRSSGCQIAVATTDNRQPTDATLRSLGVRDLVGALACGDDGFAGKPAPAAVLAVCSALRVLPERTAVVGDTPADLAMGRAAGAGLVVGVLSGLGGRADLESHADLVLGSVAELA